MSMVEMADRTGISRDTLHRLERGDASISIATLLTVLSIVNLETDLDRIAADDLAGRSLQDMALARRPKRARHDEVAPGIRRQDLVDFAQRDWSAIAEVKSDRWLERKRRLGGAEAFRIADDLRRHVALTRPDWPDSAERSEDIASHVSVGDRLRRVRDIRPR
jgi:transcriptional regulator with XRE-family HTH domain